MKHEWYVPLYRGAFLWRYRVQRVKYENFAGVCMTLDTKAYWTRAAAERRADELNAMGAK